MSRLPSLEYPAPLTAEDAVRHALAAYYLTVKDCTPPLEMPVPGSPWSGPELFVGTLADLFLCRVNAHSHPDPEVRAGEAARLARWESTVYPRHYRDVDPGHWAALQAEAMAHGCAAVDLGGGTASVTRHEVGDAAPSPDCLTPSPAKPLSARDTS